MDFEQALRGRRSVRDYRREPLGADTLLKLIQAAALAPSAMNEQPWRFNVIMDAERLDRLSDAAKRHLLAGPVGEGPHAEHAKAMLGDPTYQIFYHAPALVVIAAPESSPWAVEDCALAAQNFMLAAYAAGLGTCWIGFAQGYLNTPEGKSAIGLAQDMRAVAPLIVGWPVAPAPAVARSHPKVEWIN